MTHDEAKALTLPAECWTTGSTPGDLWMPLPVRVLGYGICGDASVPSLLCRDARGEFLTTVDLIFTTKARADADVLDVLQESYGILEKSINDANAEMAKLKQHPLWKELP